MEMKFWLMRNTQKENNLKVEEANHEQKLDSVYDSSQFKYDICKKC